MGALSPAILLDALKKERIKRSAEASLLEFAKQAWPIIEPSNEFKLNWHLEAIAEHLEAVSLGEIQNLLINIPPGCMKSILVSVIWPAWEWLLDPSLRILNASYGEDLSVRDASKTRDIILSDWYQQNWPHVRIIKGEDQKTKYALTGRGWRMSTSVGGRATGEHPDRKIVDDPHSAKQAASDAERATGVNWFNNTLSTRGVSRGAKTVVVMQRLHEQDISGFILDNFDDYTHLCLPMRFESAMVKPPTILGFKDPRTIEGSLLWPEMFPEEKVVKLEKALGEYGSAGQLQQRPSPAGGGILKTKFIQKWPSGKELPEFDFVIQSYDTAFTEKTTGCPSACTVWGTARYEGKQIALLLDCFTDRLGYPQLKKKVIDEWGSTYGPSARLSDTILVEKKASGQSILQDLRQAGIPAASYDPGRSDKVVRAHAIAPIIEAEIVYIPESNKNPGQFVSWAKPLLKEMEVFPNGAYKDLVDSTTQALIYLKDSGWITSPGYEEPEEEDHADDKPSNRNPYAQ